MTQTTKYPLNDPVYGIAGLIGTLDTFAARLAEQETSMSEAERDRAYAVLAYVAYSVKRTAEQMVDIYESAPLTADGANNGKEAK